MATARAGLLLAALVYPAAFAQTVPAPADPQALIERARAYALAYSKSLANFTCTRLITRSADDSTTGNRYKQLETQEGELRYVDRKETYEVQKINGETTKLDKHVKKGYFIPGGEFGASLAKIFAPQAKAEFTFDRAETSQGRPSCIFRYNVPQSTTTYGITADGTGYPLAHHGVVHVDCETGAVTNFRIESDTPTVVFKGHKIVIGNNLEVHYTLTSIGDKQFLLPQDAGEVNRFHKRLTKVDIQFRGYRKFDSTSTVTFGSDK
jgi:hypothetical protein